ncbi:MAG: hypothetical protein WAW75_03180 [Gallionella sp.]
MMRILPALLIFLYAAAASAENFPDPTRPPAWLLGTASMPGNQAGQSAGESRASGLQSTIISASRRAAIIDGNTVELWGKHGSAQLIEVNEGSVVLQRAQTKRVLTLFPNVHMKLKEIKTIKTSPASEAQPIEIRPEADGTAAEMLYKKRLSGHQEEEK